jgi:hypothetical protein
MEKNVGSLPQLFSFKSATEFMLRVLRSKTLSINSVSDLKALFSQSQEKIRVKRFLRFEYTKDLTQELVHSSPNNRHFRFTLSQKAMPNLSPKT